MKRNLTVLFSVMFLLSLSSAAFAAGPEPFNFNADCDGWSLDGYMFFSGGDQVDYTFWVALVQDGDTLCYYPLSGTMYEQGPFSFGDEWCGEFCGELKAVVWFMWVGIYGPGTTKAEIPFYCECNGEENGECTYTPGYWKTHPDAWPVENLTLGGVYYTKNQLMQIFWTPPAGGDITVVLAHHLIAAKLNVANGADDSIQDTIDEADAYLEMYPLFSNPKRAAKAEGERIKDILCAYNELPCEEDYDDGMDMLTSKTASETLNAPAAATEEISWGALKKMQ